MCVCIASVSLCVCMFVQVEELRLLKEKTHKDLWSDDLDAFLAELEVGTLCTAVLCCVCVCLQ